MRIHGFAVVAALAGTLGHLREASAQELGRSFGPGASVVWSPGGGGAASRFRRGRSIVVTNEGMGRTERGFVGGAIVGAALGTGLYAIWVSQSEDSWRTGPFLEMAFFSALLGAAIGGVLTSVG